MNMFARGLAPISDAAWNAIDGQAAATLRANLSARRFADVKGPYGWERSCVALGGLETFQRMGDVGYGVHKCVRFTETRADFTLDSMELHNIERGCDNPDLTAVERAAAAAAAFEDKMVYEGLTAAGVRGMSGHSDLEPVTLPSDPEQFLCAVKDAVTNFEVNNSISGPFAFVGGRKLRSMLDKIVHGRTLLEVVSKNSSVSEYIYTPSFDGAFLVSKRGGDFELYIGGDFSVGFTSREDMKMNFFIAESVAFRVVEPKAFVELKI